MPRRARPDTGILGILALALILRLHDIGLGDVWIDEANGILTARGPLGALFDSLSRDSSPPLYYLLLHVWIGLFGDGAIALRLLSTLFSLLLVALLFAVGRRVVSRDAGLWAAFFAALSPVQIFYSQQVRMYTLLPLLALASVWFLLRALAGGRRRDLALCVLAATAALYTHNFALYLGLVLAAVVAVSGSLWRRLPAWLAAFAVVAVCYAPWVPTFLRQLANEDHYAWFLPLWKDYGVAGAVLRTFRSFSPAGEFLMYEHTGAPPFHGVPALASAALAALGAWHLLRRRPAPGWAGALWIPLLLLLPMAAALALSSLVTPHYVPGRVDQMMFPAYALLVGTGASRLRVPAVRTGLAGALLVLSAATKSVFYTDYEAYGYRGTDRDLAARVVEIARPGDVILCTSLTRAPLEYYLSRAGVDLPILSYPRSAARHMGSQNDRRLASDPAALRREAKIVVDDARRAAGPGGRLILLRGEIVVNDFLAPGNLRRVMGVEPERRLGRYVQAGTEERIRLSLNRLWRDPS